VLIADDQELARSGFRMVLEAEPDLQVVGEAANGVEAIELAKLLRPEIVLMDVRMPKLDGIESARRIAALELDERPRILMVTAFGDQHAEEALMAGASGFLPKAAPAEELTAAVRAVAGLPHG
jgi:DNA-binding NarL/FixJ family response regulator